MEDFPYKEIANIFFKKSTSGKFERKALKKNKELLILLAVVLFCALGLGLIIIRTSGKNRAIKIADQYSDIFYSENIIKSGKLNSSKVKDIYLTGGALLNFSIKLVSSKATGSASLRIVLNEPVNLSEKFLLLSAKTTTRKREIELILKDAENRFYRIPNIQILPDWTSKSIYLKKKDNFNFEEIKEIEIASAIRETEDVQNSTVYVRDIIIRPYICIQ